MERIREAIVARDPDRAEAAVWGHLRDAAEIARKLLAGPV
jgi:DNA-binding FadR family transcriptional regulator